MTLNEIVKFSKTCNKQMKKTTALIPSVIVLLIIIVSMPLDIPFLYQVTELFFYEGILLKFSCAFAISLIENTLPTVIVTGLDRPKKKWFDYTTIILALISLLTILGLLTAVRINMMDALFTAETPIKLFGDISIQSTEPGISKTAKIVMSFLLSAIPWSTSLIVGYATHKETIIKRRQLKDELNPAISGRRNLLVTERDELSRIKDKAWNTHVNALHEAKFQELNAIMNAVYDEYNMQVAIKLADSTNAATLLSPDKAPIDFLKGRPRYQKDLQAFLADPKETLPAREQILQPVPA